MPDVAARIRAFGSWLAVIVLLVCATVCVKVASDERTVAARLKLAETELSREREANARAHAASLADRTVTKATQAAMGAAVDRNNARIAALEARVAVIEAPAKDPRP